MNVKRGSRYRQEASLSGEYMAARKKAIEGMLH